MVWPDDTYRIFGASRDTYEPSAQNLLGILHPDDRGVLMQAFNRGVHEHANGGIKFRIIRPNGEIRTVASQADTAYDEAGQPLYVSVAMMDVTDKEAAAKRQSELERQLRHSEKLTALGTLAGGIAHDLNNTLVPIQALSKLAMRGIPPDAPARADLDSIHQASLQARDLVRRILAFSRKQEIAKEPTDLGATVSAALHLLRATLPSTIELAETIAPVPSILADSGQIQQAVINLVTNAAHAIGTRVGRIAVAVEPGNDESPDGLNMIRIVVADTGCGMPEEVKHRMFEPFFTTKAVGEGTGLGLSAVHGIVADHGGTIDVDSAPGQGTRIAIMLPARREIDDDAIAAVA